MRTIKVTGKGQLRLRPDTTCITVILTGLYKDYAETLSRSARDTEALADLLSGFGFAREDLKTISFGVDTEYENYRDKEGDFKQRFAGYRFNHVMKVAFPSDNERLGKILYALANGGVRAEFRLSYTVKDQEAAKNRLLAGAVTDAREKAAVLAQAGGVRLKEIQSIDYSWGELNFEYRPMNGEVLMSRSFAAKESGYEFDIEPDDIELSDTVTVIWEIE